MPAITAEALRNGDFRTVARSISIVENSKPGSDELLRSIQTKYVPVIGITGPPGAGKSTIVDALIKKFTHDEKKLAVLCVDPSSSFHSGALLGDRIRMNRWFDNPRVFVRSFASRGAIGGLNSRIFQITDLLAFAGFDYILIETVGVGQTEVEITKLADQVVLVLVPESGDDIQTMKSGIMEIGDIFVVNKSDRPGAEQFLLSLKSSIQFQTAKSVDEISFIKTVATEEKGIAELYEAIRNIHRLKRGPSLQQLTHKAWQIISEHRMRDVKMDSLMHSLEIAVREPDFNIYRFAESVSLQKSVDKFE
ncbi:MAG: methylmalonyl Co-A mutase-associated GTPase MeaB [Bacteroidota bacterium]|nr:methylmalonyl Co-A mutase-associated GTPase MeaB [Bacteroidota bacterium]